MKFKGYFTKFVDINTTVMIHDRQVKIKQTLPVKCFCLSMLNK